MLIVRLFSTHILKGNDAPLDEDVEIDGFRELKVLGNEKCTNFKLDGGRYRISVHCDGVDQQYFKHLSNGRIINLENKWCMSVEDDNIISRPCRRNDDSQKWTYAYS